jgi:hypothetical protein
MSTNFYRPNGMGSGEQFNSWKNGSTPVAIVGITEITGDALAKCLAQKSQKRGYQVTKLDINVIIEFKKEGYEYTKKLFYTLAFDRDKDGNITTSGSTDGKSDLRTAYKLFDTLLCKPQIGLDVKGNIITEQGKTISNIASLMKTMVSPTAYKFLAIVIKRPQDQYYNAKGICRNDVDSALKIFQQDLDYWMKDLPVAYTKNTEADTSFDFGDDQVDQAVKANNEDEEVIFEI